MGKAKVNCPSVNLSGLGSKMTRDCDPITAPKSRLGADLHQSVETA
jgi:hypothetical protein